MTTPQLLKALFGEAPYFGGMTFGFQGPPVRQMMMLSAVNLISSPDRPLRILEVGSWIGSSALTFAQGIEVFNHPAGGEIVCVDTWAPYASDQDKTKDKVYEAMTELADSDLAYQLFLHNVSCVKGNISVSHHRGASADILPTLDDAQFDLVYLDGSHYRDDIALDLIEGKRLVRDGGLLTGDDLEAQVGDIDLDFALAHLDEDYCQEPGTGVQYHPGVSLAIHDFFGRKIPTHHGFWTTQRRGDNLIDFALDGGRFFVPRHFGPQQQQQCQALIDHMKSREAQ